MLSKQDALRQFGIKARYKEYGDLADRFDYAEMILSLYYPYGLLLNREIVNEFLDDMSPYDMDLSSFWEMKRKNGRPFSY